MLYYYKYFLNSLDYRCVNNQHCSHLRNKNRVRYKFDYRQSSSNILDIRNRLSPKSFLISILFCMLLGKQILLLFFIIDEKLGPNYITVRVSLRLSICLITDDSHKFFMNIEVWAELLLWNSKYLIIIKLWKGLESA